jgi:hypothetical protein
VPDFSADLAPVEWVLTGYVLASSSLSLIGDALADVRRNAARLSH